MRSKKAIINIISNLLLQVIIIAYGFIVPKLIISNYGSEINGLISSITQFLGYITLLESGFCPVVKSLLYEPISKNDSKTITSILKTSEIFFKKIALIFIIYIILLSILYPLFINTSFSILYTISLIIIISISIFFEYYFGMVYRIFLQANQENYVISFIQALTYMLSIFVIVIAVKYNSDIILLKLFSGLVFILRPLLQNFYVKKKYKIKIDENVPLVNIKQKWDGLVQHIAYVVNSNTDIAILSIFVSLKEVSVYSVYSIITNGIKSICTGFLGGIDSLFGDMIAKKEMLNLKENFSIYETVYLTIITILFSCTMVLIVPFVLLYTKGINDVNYNREIFGYLLVISQFMWTIRQPYNELIKAACKFKETRNGAIIEAVINIIISIILVSKFGIIGVTFGTIIAMLIRTIEFIFFTNKNIINRNSAVTIKKLLLVTVECTIAVFLSKHLILNADYNYFCWILNALMVVFVNSLVIFSINFIFLKNDFINCFNIVKKICKRNKS